MAKTGIMIEPKRIKKSLAAPAKEQKEETIQPIIEQSTGVKPRVKHHELFVYPPRPKPNPALAPFFEKLNEVKNKLNS